jgi:hypothetical protein
VKLSSRLCFPFFDHERVRLLDGLMNTHVRLSGVKELLIASNVAKWTSVV